VDVIGHRGLHAGARPAENSLGAIRAAARAGFRWIEVDVRAAADGDLFLLHDPFLDRTTTTAGRLRSLTGARARTLRLIDGSPLPRLEDGLEAAEGATLCLDVKESDVAPRLLDAVTGRGAGVEVWSEHAAVITAAADAGVSALLISNGLLREGIGAFLWQALNCGARRVSFYPADLEPHVAAACHNAGLGFLCGTPNDVRAWRYLYELGASGIITDRPVECRAAVARWQEPVPG
jgi:glycerophosphoryl diester phosphodiesterase